LTYNFKAMHTLVDTDATAMSTQTDYSYVASTGIATAPWAYAVNDSLNGKIRIRTGSKADSYGVDISTSYSAAAFRINVPQSGYYDVSVTFLNSRTYLGTMHLYLNSFADGPLNEEGLLGTITTGASGSSTTTKMAEKIYLEEGEYYYTVKLGEMPYVFMKQLILTPSAAE